MNRLSGAGFFALAAADAFRIVRIFHRIYLHPADPPALTALDASIFIYPILVEGQAIE